MFNFFQEQACQKEGYTRPDQTFSLVWRLPKLKILVIPQTQEYSAKMILSGFWRLIYLFTNLYASLARVSGFAIKLLPDEAAQT